MLKCKQIQSLRVVSRNRHYHNSQTIYGKWDERTLVVGPLIYIYIFFFYSCSEDQGEKNRGDYVNFCFGYIRIVKIILCILRKYRSMMRWPTENVSTKAFRMIPKNIFYSWTQVLFTHSVTIILPKRLLYFDLFTSVKTHMIWQDRSQGDLGFHLPHQRWFP